MIQAVFFDLDGTLLDESKRIPSSARAAILSAREKGISFYFATARSPRLGETLGWQEGDFALFDGGVYSNGGCMDIRGEREFTFIDPKAVQCCLEEVKKYPGVHLSLHMPGDGYAFNFPVAREMEAGWGLKNARIQDIEETDQNSIAKILIFYDHLTDAVDALPGGLWEDLRRLCAPFARIYLTDQGRTIQVTGLDAGKKNAIERIRRRMKWGMDHVAVFGDDINDLEMISFYPNSIAMGNGDPAVRKAAAFVTGDNQGDGIARGIAWLMEK